MRALARARAADDERQRRGRNLVADYTDSVYLATSSAMPLPAGGPREAQRELRVRRPVDVQVARLQRTGDDALRPLAPRADSAHAGAAPAAGSGSTCE